MDGLTVNQMIEFLTECRDRGMGEAMIVHANDYGQYKKLYFKSTQAFAVDRDGDVNGGELLLVDGVNKGREGVCVW